ncbi:hypothetical protein BamIOP4010DRAFT_6403 [Burkholderia ambifaria IOP40-10]|uniref:Uncharacterized protein n=1 Tax=Burkholderia ambifaria IOP40-10 TaxID=396596 RepID=B1FQU2_9BURK|nr:hypothetical protein BamIOP4010DRAFT_6403 [Burkholderia ambifaria IOP40-10]
MVVVAEGAAATEAPPDSRGAERRARAQPETGRHARGAPLRRTTYRRMAFTSAGVTFAGWPPHVARR